MGQEEGLSKMVSFQPQGEHRVWWLLEGGEAQAQVAGGAGVLGQEGGLSLGTKPPRRDPRASFPWLPTPAGACTGLDWAPGTAGPDPWPLSRCLSGEGLQVSPS